MSGNAHKTTLSKREQSQKWADARPIIRQCLGLELRRQLPGLWVPTAQLIPVGLPKNTKIWLDKEAAHDEDDVGAGMSGTVVFIEGVGESQVVIFKHRFMDKILFDGASQQAYVSLASQCIL